LKEGLILDDILNVKEPADRVHMSLSPDHKWLAFCLGGKAAGNSQGVSMAVEGTKQWVCEVESGEIFQIAPEANSSWAGVWSPDGKTLAFYADIGGRARLWFWSPLEKTLKLASEVLVRPFFGFEKPIWTKNGDGIIIKALPSEPVDDLDFSSSSTIDLNKKINSTKQPLVFSTSRSPSTLGGNDQNILSWINRYHADLLIIDATTGETAPLCLGERPVGIFLSHDGENLAFTSCQGEERSNSQQNVFDLWVCSISKKEAPRCVANNIRMDYGLSFSWGFDNHTIYYTTSGPLSDGGLWSIQISSLNEQVPLGKPKDIHLRRDYDGPIPLPNREILLVAKGRLWHYSSEDNIEEIQVLDRGIRAAIPVTNLFSKNIIVQTQGLSEMSSGFWSIDLTTWKAERILEELKGHMPWFEGGCVYGEHQTSSIIGYMAQCANEPPMIKLLNVTHKTNQTVELTKINKEHLGTSELLVWKKKELSLRGALLLPHRRKGRVPVIMRVYGGSTQSKNLRYFGLSSSNADNHQLFASNGYAVFLPDLPMSRSHDPADEIAEAIEDALKVLMNHPEIDPDRIGIIGHSFGGYSALVAITRIPLFKAAVISAGIGNLISFYTRFDPSFPIYNYGMVEDGQANMGATLWEEKDRYIRNSPLFDLDKITSPVLLIQGTCDHHCRGEAGPIFSSLNRLGKTAELVLYDEEHWQGTWSKENLQDYYNRVLSWYGKYL
jgi:acetyl esterase/lipase